MKKYNGFTLIEIIVVSSILIIVSSAIYLNYTLSQKAYREAELSAEITQNGRVIIERISREIRQTKEIVGDFPEEEPDAQSEIFFEDGHVSDSYNYIHYFISGNEVKREVLGYYFSGDLEQNLVPWNALPPEGQTLEIKALEEERIVGEWVSGLSFWGRRVVNISVALENKGKTITLETKIFGRNF